MNQLFYDIISAPYLFILEVIVIGLIINLFFATIFMIIYYSDETHFATYKTNREPHKLNFFDMFYFSNCTFFQGAANITPSSIISRIVVTIEIIISYIFTALIIGKIINIPITQK